MIIIIFFYRNGGGGGNFYYYFLNHRLELKFESKCNFVCIMLKHYLILKMPEGL